MSERNEVTREYYPTSRHTKCYDAFEVAIVEQDYKSAVFVFNNCSSLLDKKQYNQILSIIARKN